MSDKSSHVWKLRKEETEAIEETVEHMEKVKSEAK